ncbi:hypothetical protein ES703_53470 [subsurface metagenome]
MSMEPKIIGTAQITEGNRIRIPKDVLDLLERKDGDDLIGFWKDDKDNIIVGLAKVEMMVTKKG